MADTSGDYMRDKISTLMKNKQDIKNRKAEEQQNSRVVTGLNLYEEGFNTQNEDLKKKYDVASKGAELASMIVDYGKSKGITISGTDAEIINTYLKGNPEKSKMLYDYTHSNIDPDKFAIQMGWMKEPEKESSFISNAVGGFYDAATSIPRWGAKGISNAIGWVAKQFGADEARVDELVKSYQDYIDSDWSGEALGADKESGTYKTTKFLGDMGMVATGEGLAKAGLKTALGGYPLITKATPLGVKAAAGAIEGAADMGLYSMQADNELPSVGDLALGAGIGVAAPLAGAALKGAKNMAKKGAVNLSEDILQNMNRMTKGEQAEFFRMAGQTEGKFLNDRGLRSVGDATEYWQKSKNTVDNAMGQIQGRFTSPELTQALEGVYVNGKKKLGGMVEFTKNTLSPYAERMAELAEKNRNGGLTMSEINEVKRAFEKAYKFNYGMIEKNAEKLATATNLDNQLRERQFKTAEENGFGNLRELNKETQAAKYIADKAGKWEKGIEGNNLLSLTDWITVMGAGVSPKAVSSLLSKKIFQTPAVKNKIVDMLNWVAGHENMAEKTVDLQKIMELNSVKEVDRLYKEFGVGSKTPRLPEQINGGGITAGEKGFVTQNPTAPTFEGMELQNTRGIKEVNTAGKQGTKMYDIANQRYRGISDDILANGGATLDASTLSKVGGDYYAVSLFPSRNVQIPKSEFRDQHVLDYVEQNADRLLQPGNSLGAWVSPTDMVHLDVSTTLPKQYEKEIKELAKKYNQEAIYDLGTFEEIPTGGNGEPMDIDEEEVVEILKNLLSKKK